LYAKQSFTAYPMCEYPAGYIEPYPKFYAGVKFFAEEAARRFERADFNSKDPKQANAHRLQKQHYVAFFKRMAGGLGKLEPLAQKEWKAEPFSEEEKKFLKKTIDRRGGGSGPPRYDGWYADLFFHGHSCSEWDPTVADVHTDPESRSCLEVAVGDVN